MLIFTHAQQLFGDGFVTNKTHWFYLRLSSLRSDKKERLAFLYNINQWSHWVLLICFFLWFYFVSAYAVNIDLLLPYNNVLFTKYHPVLQDKGLYFVCLLIVCVVAFIDFVVVYSFWIWRAFSCGYSIWSVWCCWLATGRGVCNFWCRCCRVFLRIPGWLSMNYK